MNELKLINKLFYQIKPFIPRKLQLILRRIIVSRKRLLYADIWPIDRNADTPPDGWSGWPEDKKFALVLTHDVDTEEGHNKCRNLVSMEEDLGFKSSFNFVPERYRVSPKLRHHIVSSGFEVGVHGLNHDGKLYKSRDIFETRAYRINQYIEEWGAVGFRSPGMHRNLKWIHDLNILYDASTFDTDPFEPLSDGVSTIFPFWVKGHNDIGGYVELPYTLPQDFTLFVIMRERDIDIWKRKLDWIVEKGGMVLINTHPDYMNFNGGKLGLEEYPYHYYEELLEYVKIKYFDQYWNVLPKDLTRYYLKSRIETNN